MKLKMLKIARILLFISVLMTGCKKEDLSSCEKVKKQGTSDQTLLVGNWELDYVQKGNQKEKPDYIYYLRIFDPSVGFNANWWFMTFRPNEDATSKINFRAGNALYFGSIIIEGHYVWLENGSQSLVGLPREQDEKESKYFSRVKYATCYSVTKKRLYLLCEGENGLECFVYKRDNSDKYEN